MQAIADSLLSFIAAHPGLSGVILFLLSFGEAVVGFGYLVPGTYIMVGAGILVGHGSLGFPLASGSLIAGGILGDALSYWLGHRYSERILAHRFFAKRPRLIERTRALTARHGAKAVIAARFIGNIRPLVPFLAALCGMRPARFMFFNAFGAIVATPLHLLVGMAIGLGLHFTGAMTIRAVILLALVALVVWLGAFAARRTVRLLARRGPALLARLAAWARARHDAPAPGRRLAARLVSLLTEPSWRGRLALLIVGLAALGCLAGLAAIVEASAAQAPLSTANRAVFAFFQGLRTPAADGAMAALAALGGLYPLLGLLLAVQALLLAAKARQAALLWAVATGLGLASAWALREVAGGFAGAAADAGLFSDGHTVLSVVVLGSLAWLLGAAVHGPGARAAIGAAAFALILLIGIAQLYAGVVHVSDLAGGLLLGLFWLLLLGVAARGVGGARARPWRPGLWALAPIFLVATVAAHEATPWRLGDLGPDAAAEPRELAAAAWLSGGWRDLPAYRDDFAGSVEEPINLQIAGDAGAIVARLRAAGWSPAPAWGLNSVADLVLGLEDPAAPGRPVLPRLWNGRPDRFAFVRAAEGGRLIVRLWDQGYRLTPSGAPLYLGTVEREVFAAPIFFGLIELPPRAGDFSAADRALASDLAPDALRPRGPDWRSASSHGAPVPWDGSTVVVNSRETDAARAR